MHPGEGNPSRVGMQGSLSQHDFCMNAATYCRALSPTFSHISYTETLHQTKKFELLKISS